MCWCECVCTWVPVPVPVRDIASLSELEFQVVVSSLKGGVTEEVIRVFWKSSVCTSPLINVSNPINI